MKTFLRTTLASSLVLLTAQAAQPAPAEVNRPIYDAPRAAAVANPRLPAVADGIDQDSTIFLEDFETEPTDWSTQDLTDIGPQWHPDPFFAYDGDSWWCGDSTYMGYYNCWLQYLVSPTLNLQGTSNPQLTFRVRWAVENPGVSGQYNGYDGCNVWISTDNGGTWQVVNPVSPAYNCSSLKSFGAVFGFGPGIPGWADSLGIWQTATFNLTGYQTRYVKVRWAFCSDGAVCSMFHPGITGMFVDDIVLTSGTDTLLYNNADGAQIPAALTTEAGPPMGDYWAWSSLSSHSPTHSERVDNDHYYLNDMLISPPISIPAGYTAKYKFWVRCDLPDSTHPSSPNPNMLRDYYVVRARVVGGEWDTLFYDYARGGAGYPDWALMTHGVPYNGDSTMSLSQYAGQTIQLGWDAIMDGDDLQGQGQGLFIDDVEVYVNALPDNDVGIEYIHIPFPTSVSSPVTGEVKVRNYGLNQNMFYAFWRTDGQLHPVGLTPVWTMPGESDSTVDISFTPDDTGMVFIDAYTTMTGDQNPANDTSWAGAVEIFPQGDWMAERGYDARGYSYLSTLLALQYNQGAGPLVHFDDIYCEGFDYLRFLFWETGQFTLHLYDQGTASMPGPELGTVQVTIGSEQIYPNWLVVDITEIPEMGYRFQGFWAWLEMTQPGGGPDLVADYAHFGQGYFFDYNGSSLYDTEYDFYLRALVNDQVGVPPEPPAGVPTAFMLEAVHPNPFNPVTRIAFTLPGAGAVNLSAYDLAGRRLAQIASGEYPAGRHELAWDAASFGSGIYLLRLESPWGVQVQKAVVVK